MAHTVILSHVAFIYFGPEFLQTAIGLLWFLGVGVLLCRGHRLLTGSNTRWLRLWEVEAVRGVKPQENVGNVKERSVAHPLMIVHVLFLLLFSLIILHAILCLFLYPFQIAV